MYNLSFPKEVIIKNNDVSQYMYLGNHINQKDFLSCSQYLFPQQNEIINPYEYLMLADRPLKAFMDGFLVPPIERYRAVYLKGVSLNGAKEWREPLAENPSFLTVQVDGPTSPCGAFFTALFTFNKGLSDLFHQLKWMVSPYLFQPNYHDNENLIYYS